MLRVRRFAIFAAPLAAACCAAGCDDKKSAPLPATTSAPPAIPAGSMDDLCYGKKALTVDERMQIQLKIDDNKHPCPLWATPSVSIKEDGISLNGRAVVPKEDLPDADQLAKLESLRERLSAYRKRWKSFQPNQQFPGGPITIQAPEGFPTAPVVSAFVSSGLAGYPFIRLKAGTATAELTAVIPPPPGGTLGGLALYVEPTGGGKATAGVLRDGATLNPKKEGVSVSDADRWLRSLYPDGSAKLPRLERLVFRPQKVPIEETLQQLNYVVKTGAFRRKPPDVSFAFRCLKGPTDLEHTLAAPWSRREPERPCF